MTPPPGRSVNDAPLHRGRVAFGSSYLLRVLVREASHRAVPLQTGGRTVLQQLRPEPPRLHRPGSGAPGVGPTLHSVPSTSFSRPCRTAATAAHNQLHSRPLTKSSPASCSTLLPLHGDWALTWVVVGPLDPWHGPPRIMLVPQKCRRVKSRTRKPSQVYGGTQAE